MKDFKSLKGYSIIILFLLFVNSIYEVYNIFNIWFCFENPLTDISKIDFANYTILDKIISSIFNLLDILLLLPAFWFYKISNAFTNQKYFKSKVIDLLQKISNLLYVLSGINLLILIFYTSSNSYYNLIFGFSISPLFIMFLGTIFNAFSIILKEAKIQKDENELTI